MAIKENALPVSQSIGSGDYLRKVSSGGVSQQVPFSEVKDAVVTIDPAIDSESENPVQNKAIAAALDAAGTQTKQDIAAAIQTEVTNRNSAISQAISTEVSNRNQAIASAIQTETADRNAAIEEAIADEVTDRNAAIESAIDDEETARNTAISEAVAAEAQAREAADEELNQSKADTDGNYPDMTVGNADQLISSIYIEDQTPYNFRQSGGGLSIGDLEIDKIVGGTVAWNQLLPTISAENWAGQQASIVSVSGTTIEVTANSGDINVYNPAVHPNNMIAFIEGHKYLCSLKFKSPKAGYPYYRNNAFGSSFPLGTTFAEANVWRTYASVARATSTVEWQGYFGQGNATTAGLTYDDVISFKDIVLVDLTAMFGTTIADYIYSLEQANAGAGVAWFKKLFPKDYYAYNAGELISVSGLESHDTVGFNQWDEEWELGGYDTTTGEPVARTDTIRSKNYVHILPNTSYYVKCSATMVICYYDADKNYVGYVEKSNSVVTTPSNACYLRFRLATNYGTTYNNDICINLSWSGYRNGEYEPYEKHSYPLDNSLTLRGIPKLDSSNNLYYDGDEYKADGSVNRRYGVVDLGSLNTWIKADTVAEHWRFRAELASVKGFAQGIPNMICSKYPTVTAQATYTGGIKGISTHTGDGYIWVCDESYTDVASFKTAMSGVYLVYELATPTTETAAPYTNPQTVSDWGTEEYVDAAVQEGDRDVAVPVGHVTDYLANLRDKLQNLPDAAGADGTYLVQQTSGQMALLAYTPGANIPAAPTTDGTYTLQAVVSGGVATYSWVSS